MALIDHYDWKKKSRVPASKKVEIVSKTFAGMLFGQIKPKGRGGPLGLRAPMSYPAFFLIAYVILRMGLILVFGSH
jgi:hypothetical protein